MACGNRFLRMIHILAQGARHTNVEIQNLHDEESTTDEFQFYKNRERKFLHLR